MKKYILILSLILITQSSGFSLLSRATALYLENHRKLALQIFARPFKATAQKTLLWGLANYIFGYKKFNFLSEKDSPKGSFSEREGAEIILHTLVASSSHYIAWRFPRLRIVIAIPFIIHLARTIHNFKVDSRPFFWKLNLHMWYFTSFFPLPLARS